VEGKEIFDNEHIPERKSMGEDILSLKKEIQEHLTEDSLGSKEDL
jgi:hypothetical protein